MNETVRASIAEARAARSAGRTEEARATLERALAMCRGGSGVDEELVEVLKALGQIDRDEGRPEAALPRYQEAVAVSRRGHDAAMLAHTVRHLGDVHRDLGRLAEAEPLYLEALALYRANPMTATLDLANALRPLALLTQRLHRADEARRLWLEAKAFYAEAGIAEGVAECERHLRQLED